MFEVLDNIRDRFQMFHNETMNLNLGRDNNPTTIREDVKKEK